MIENLFKKYNLDVVLEIQTQPHIHIPSFTGSASLPDPTFVGFRSGY
jgi:hypothetical protein